VDYHIPEESELLEFDNAMKKCVPESISNFVNEIPALLECYSG